MLLASLVLFGAIGAKLVKVQVVDGPRFAQVGESQLVHTEKLPAARGTIFDRNGVELAMTIRQSTVWANPRAVTDPVKEADALASVLQLDREFLLERLRTPAAFVYLARKVSDATAKQVEALGLDGVYLMEEPRRFTPAGDLASPVLGLVGTDNEGLGGVELKYEGLLRGKPGLLVVEQDPSGYQIPGGVRERQPSIRGDDLMLTIDRALQYETERALAAEIAKAKATGGVAVVMDVKTGEIVAMANLTAEAGENIRQAPSNLAVTQAYEPGSVNKLITIGAALEDGLVAPDTTIRVPTSISVGGALFSEHEPHPTIDWNVTEIVANSSNVGSIMIGQQLGKDRLDHYLRSFGFGSSTALGFPGETPGIMLDTDKWSGSSIGTIPIGQGIAVTAVQMLAAYNTVANGGLYVAPKLIKAVVGSDGKPKLTEPSPTRRVVSPTTARQLNEMLSEVVRAGTGTNAAIDGYTVAGKTGTARKPLEGARGYKTGAYMSSFAGFVPAEKPALSALVMLDEPTPIFGGLVAAPVFAEITKYGLRHFRIPPPRPAQKIIPSVDPETARPVGEVGGTAAAATLPRRNSPTP
ncbi:MAG: peptidoglycan D,D-transpeptidase FtsI family protein [Acidimicrobiales bacterium]